MEFQRPPGLSRYNSSMGLGIEPLNGVDTTQNLQTTLAHLNSPMKRISMHSYQVKKRTRRLSVQNAQIQIIKDQSPFTNGENLMKSMPDVKA